jgi:predicted regulator of Ras-like GTPase activity (Roadblock/LC7/MglB family)
MTIPNFLGGLYQKVRTRISTMSTRQPGHSPAGRTKFAKKEGGERLSKTVLPNTTRSLSAPDPFHTASGSPLGRGSRGSDAHDLPRALAMALEPKMERAISLCLTDFIDQVPADYIKPVEIIDASRCVALKASEIEKGMPSRNPSISLPSLYQQVPEIFLRSVPPTDTTRIPLPYDKVLEQFTSVRVRSDQVRDQQIPQLDTPILQATLEDTKRFGTKMEPLETSALPPVPVEPATAEALASAEPEPVAYESVRSTSPELKSPYPVISLHGADLKTISKKDLPKLESDSHAPPPPLSKIPFHFPPNGTGAPASERVPASSGPPVPTISPPPSEPQRIPFTPAEEIFTPEIPASAQASAMEPPETAEAPAPQPARLTPEAAAVPEPVDKDAGKIAIALKPLLQNVPAFQLSGDVSAIADDVRVEFPLSLIEPQLASGRVVVPPKIFHQAMPEQLRFLFIVDLTETPVSLPLSEVLKNLPAGALKLRPDQERVFSEEEDLETPFSIKAKEDAERFQPPMAEVSPAQVSEEPSEEAQAEAKIETATEEKSDPKEVLARANQVAGVRACEITFPDGLSLAGNFPPEVTAEGLCAMAPMVLQRIDQHMVESQLGPLASMTLHSATSAITFFMKENICLAALHDDAAGLSSDARAQLGALAEELSHAYAQEEASNVDH